jgi:hypothetical protein
MGAFTKETGNRDLVKDKGEWFTVQERVTRESGKMIVPMVLARLPIRMDTNTKEIGFKTNSMAEVLRPGKMKATLILVTL